MDTTSPSSLPPLPPSPAIVPLRGTKEGPVPHASRRLWFLAGLGILTLGILVGFLGTNFLKPSSNQSALAPTLSPKDSSRFSQLASSPTPSSDLTANWKTYINTKYLYSIKIPHEWEPERGNPGADYTDEQLQQLDRMYWRNNTSMVSIEMLNACTNLDQCFKQFQTDTSMRADTNYRYNTRGYKTTQGIYQSIPSIESKSTYGENLKAVKGIFFIYKNNFWHLESLSLPSLKEADQILSTFQFIDQNKIACGGIAGTSCTDGYTCKLDGSYPDAGGTCIQSQNEGVLKATVIRSPTCPGAQQPGETCEAPVAHETFTIFHVESTQTIQPKSKQEIRDSTEGLTKKQTVTTDAAGQFTISLEPGTYQLRNTVTGIGNDIGNRTFTIVTGQSTIQRFTIDTGIR